VQPRSSDCYQLTQGLATPGGGGATPAHLRVVNDTLPAPWCRQLVDQFEPPSVWLQVDSVPEGVVLLEHSSKLRRVEFSASVMKPLLKGLWITGCELLESVDLSGLEALQQLRVAGCPRLEKVKGADCLAELEVLDLNGCSAQLVCPHNGISG
jgi:hypothetical protein